MDVGGAVAMVVAVGTIVMTAHSMGKDVGDIVEKSTGNLLQGEGRAVLLKI